MPNLKNRDTYLRSLKSFKFIRSTIDFNDPGNDVTSFELEDLGEDPFGLGELPDPA